MTKSCEDMEDIIRILIDILDNMNIDFNTVMLKVRDKHYCLFCMQHYRHCKCDFANVDISSDSESVHSFTDDDYTSSESNHSSEKSHSNKYSDFSESESEDNSESESEENSKCGGNDKSESESEDDKIINNIISNSTLKTVILDDKATTSDSDN